MPPTRPLRIAAYGFVSKPAGSCAAAFSTLLDRLMDEGHRVDFYAVAGFVDPVELRVHPQFGDRTHRLRSMDLAWRVAEARPLRWLGLPLRMGLSRVSDARYLRSIQRSMRAEHAREPYDLLLVLGLLSPFRVPGLPCVSWPQGPPNGELEGIRSSRALIEQTGGRVLYRTLVAFYHHRIRAARRLLPNSRAVIGGSSWTVDAWTRMGVPPGAGFAVPYPIELDHFHPEGRPEPDPGSATFLWLGRIVPRKRLDLLLDAFDLLRGRRPEARLKVFGRFAYARGLRRLLDHYGPADGVEYSPGISRDAVPALLREAAALVQPSENEDFGSAVMEALACGTPAIVGPTNGMRDYLAEPSVVFDAYTPEALARAMETILDRRLDDPVARSAACRAAAERVVDPAVVLRRMHAVLEFARGRTAEAASRVGG